MRTLAAVLASSLLFLAASAAAQACPDGARGHAMPGPGPQANGYCAPMRCHTDADCGGLHCEPMHMCIGHLAGHRTAETAWHQCDPHDACNTGEHCEHASYCSNATPPGPGPGATSALPGGVPTRASSGSSARHRARAGSGARHMVRSP